MEKIIMGIRIDRRHNAVPDVQSLLTEYGCYIKTRIGLHEASDDRDECSDQGLILLEFIDNAADEADELFGQLEEIGGVTAQMMSF